MLTTWIPVWKQAPFLRLLLPLMLGILLQWYLQFDLLYIIFSGLSFVTAFFLFQLLPFSLKFKLQPLQGLLINLIIIILGLLLTYNKDIRHRKNWFGNIYRNGDYLVATINEPPIQKNKSLKADVLIESVIHDSSFKTTTGKVIVYFIQDSSLAPLKYGDKILINKPLQIIKNSGNPGAFNYQRYSAFKQLFHNVFLKKNEWVLLPEKNINYLNRFLFATRQNILNVLHKNMPEKDDQLSIAEALLIGYTQDLDKDLVQAYSNTGVVHIIAISGMHLGLIYVMLVWIFSRIPYLKRSSALRIIFVLSCLWLFALLTGGAASILRSAVMFSCIVIGENFSKRASIYNSLAASAFILLCYNPFYLWDVGFQLSYLAILGIVILQKPIYNLIFVRNKWLDKLWKLIAISLAAQTFTFPICLYYFHQFPTIFLFTNIITVPLSTAILFVEIFLIALGWIPIIGTLIGKLTWALVWLMNKTILFFNNLPFAVWERIPASITSTIFLYIIVASIAYWLLKKSKTAFSLSLFSILALMLFNTYTQWSIVHQHKIIVYNVPQHKAIDFVSGNKYIFAGDSILSVDGLLQNFHIKPARIELQLSKNEDAMETLFNRNNFYYFMNKTLLVIDSPVVYEPLQQKVNVDVIVISKNPKLYISQLAKVFNCKQYIFDASNSLWKIEKWKKDCELLHLPSYSVPEKGAFIMDL